MSTQPLNPDPLYFRREVVFLILSGIFLSSMTLLNILGTSKLIDTGLAIGSLKMTLPVGVLAYPVTFLCTDFISELYGKRRANALVWVGLGVNLWVMVILYFGGILPDLVFEGADYSAFYTIRTMALSTVIGSMIAYFLAQFIDVQIFHYLKKRTGDRMLWLRNNASTMVSQLVDSVAVILIVHYLSDGFHLKGKEDAFVLSTLSGIIVASYLFKFLIAALDTVPFYIGTLFLKKHLKL